MVTEAIPGRDGFPREYCVRTLGDNSVVMLRAAQKLYRMELPAEGQGQTAQATAPTRDNVREEQVALATAPTQVTVRDGPDMVVGAPTQYFVTEAREGDC